MQGQADTTQSTAAPLALLAGEIAGPVAEAMPGEREAPAFSSRGSERPRTWLQIGRP